MVRQLFYVCCYLYTRACHSWDPLSCGHLCGHQSFAWCLFKTAIRNSSPLRGVSKRARAQIVVVIASILLILAFLTVVWLRYTVIADQLGINPSVSAGTFGGPSTGMIWSRLGPTIVLNLLIWGLGTLYAWAVNEKVPGLRDSCRDLRRANRKLDRKRGPFEAEQRRIKAHYQREFQKNDVAIREYKNLLEEVRGTVQRLRA